MKIKVIKKAFYKGALLNPDDNLIIDYDGVKAPSWGLELQGGSEKESNALPLEGQEKITQDSGSEIEMPSVKGTQAEKNNNDNNTLLGRIINDNFRK